MAGPRGLPEEEAVALHYFHCTDGADLIVDRTGRETGSPSQLGGLARAVADEIMAAVPAHGEWTDWAVHVYDERGEVAIVPFETEAPVAPRRQKTASSKTGSTERPHALSNRRSRRPARVSPASTIASSGSRKRASSRPASSR